MTGVATAIVGAAAIGAVGTAVAGSESAGAITSSTNASIAAQQQAQAKQQQILSPYTGIGTGGGGTQGAIQQYQNLLGLGPQGAQGEQAALAATPGYQFAQQQGQAATLNAATLTNPGGVSGNTLTAIDQFSTGLANQTYQSDVGNAAQAVGIGESAAAGVGAGALQTGAGVGSTIQAGGANIAGIDANEAAGLTKAATGGASNYITANTLANLNTVPGGLNSLTNWPGVGDPLLQPQTAPG